MILKKIYWLFFLFKKRNHKDVFLRLKRLNFQKKIKRKIKRQGIDFFYSQNYLCANSKFDRIDDIIDSLNFNSNLLFPEDGLNFNLISVSLKNSIISQADKYCAHIFDLLGSGDTHVKYRTKVNGIEDICYDIKFNYEPNDRLLDNDYHAIDWSLDFKSGFRWDTNAFYTSMRSSNKNIRGVDIKVPWELSRCQHFGILGVAFNLTKDINYAREIKNQIIDWINNNPFCHGPNWVCTMDVGIRAANWLIGLELIKDSNLFDTKFKQMFLTSMVHHLEYITNNLEWTSRLTSNHYLANIAGLFFLTTKISVFKKSKKIQKFSKNELEKEITKQTYTDGMNSEGSICYHRLVLEMFAYSTLLARNMTNFFSDEYFERLKKMFDFTDAVLKPTNELPQIGDNDSGLFLVFNRKNLIKHRYLLNLGNIIFDQNKTFYVVEEEIENNLFGYSINQKNITQNSAVLHQFNESGMNVFKDKTFYVAIYNGANGQNGIGGHAHNDKLSFVLQYRGQDVFVDPGTYLYTPFPELRNQFRSTASHNTVMVSNEEQNRFFDDYLFNLHNDANTLVNEWKLSSNGFIFNGSHDGYCRIKKTLEHRRKINFSFDKQSLVILDKFEDNYYTKEFILIVHKDFDVSYRDDTIDFNLGTITFHNFKSIRLETINYSSEYGKITKDFTKIITTFDQSLKTTIHFTN